VLKRDHWGGARLTGGAGFVVAAAVMVGAWGGAARGDTLIFDNFDNVGTGSSINGRLAPVNNNNAWLSSTVSFLGNGSGGLSADTSQAKTASIDLGSSFLSTHPGIYDLSLDITQPTSTNPGSSWAALGFLPSNSVGSNAVTNNASPWMLYRYNGNVVVFAGPNTSEKLFDSGGYAPTGSPHTFRLELNTTKPMWTLGAFVDGVALDLNGVGAGTTYEFMTNPTSSHYVGMSTGVNGAASTATVDNFQLVQVTPLPSAAGMAVVGFAGLLVGRRRAR